MFLSESDYASVIEASKLSLLQQNDPAIRQRAEGYAMEEIASYLRPRYDVTAIFAASGTARNPLIVMYAIDIALYTMSSWLPAKMGSELRKERYDRAISFLVDVARGRTIPDLPTVTSGTGAVDAENPVRYGSETALKTSW